MSNSSQRLILAACAALLLVLGFGAGYLFRGNEDHASIIIEKH